MAYNHAKAYKEWLELKEKEEQLLRELGVDEKKIAELRNYDNKDFLADRRFYENENLTKEQLFIAFPIYDSIVISTPEQLLDKIDNRVVFYVLKRSDRTLLEIIIIIMLL